VSTIDRSRGEWIIMNQFIRRIKGVFNRLFGKKRDIRLGIYGEPNTGKTTLANKISMDWLGEPVGVVSEMPHTTRMIQKKEKVEVKSGNKTLSMNLLDMPGLATQVDYKQFLKFKRLPTSPVSGVAFSDLTLAHLKKIAKNKELKFTKSTKKPALIKKVKLAVKESTLTALTKELNIKVKKKKISGKYRKLEAKSLAEEATKAIIEAIKWLDNVDNVIVMMDSTKDPLTQVNIMLLGNLEAKGIPVVICANKTDMATAKPSAISDAFPQHPVVEISALKGTNLDELYSTIAKQVGV
jgi:GTPase Era involved in 16S rRNA processing